MNYQEKLEELGSMALTYLPKVLLAIVILIIGLKVANKISAIAGKALERTGLGKEIIPFLKSLIGAILKVLVVFSVAGIVGIDTASFVAVLAGMVFAIGMALQGTLGNFAAGVMILIFKPYKLEDYIHVGDHEGFVKEINIINTVVRTLNNKEVIIPNSTVIGDVVTNTTGEDGIMRVEFEVPMPYEESWPNVKSIIEGALRDTPKILKEPEPLVGINSYDSHTILIAVKPYCKIEDYEDVYFASTANVKSALSLAGIRVAYSEGVELGKIGA